MVNFYPCEIHLHSRIDSHSKIHHSLFVNSQFLSVGKFTCAVELTHTAKFTIHSYKFFPAELFISTGSDQFVK